MSLWQRLLNTLRGDPATRTADATSTQRQRLLDTPDESDAPAPPTPLALFETDAADPTTGTRAEQSIKATLAALRENTRFALNQDSEGELVLLVQEILRNGELRRGREYLAQLLQYLPEAHQLSLTLAELDYDERRFADAIPRLEALTLRNASLATRAHFLLGDYYRREANLAQALFHFEEVLARDFTYPRARSRAEDLRARLDRPVAATAPTILGERSLGASGRYVLQRELGRGGGGTVYLATDGILGRAVAVKVIHPHVARQANARAHLFCEARIAATLRHPQVVTIYDLDENLNLVAMEYCGGGTLADTVAAGPQPLHRALERLAEMARILDTVHRAGVIHRDIKPSNWLLRGDRGDPRAPIVLTDFGVAHAPIAETSDLFAGSRAYMPPEQRDGATPDPSMDLYATGLIAIELILGHSPLTPEQVLQGTDPLAIPETFAPLRDLVPDALASTVEALLRHLLAAKPADRPHDAATLAAQATALAESARQAAHRAQLTRELERRAGPAPRPKSVEAWIQRSLDAL